MIRGFPNGETQPGVNTRLPCAEYIGCTKRTRGSEPSQYPEEEKTTVIPIVVASELGTA